jgi:hypothetical protein
VTVDPVEAFRWFEQGAQNGNADAQKVLGVAYAQGRGVARDVDIARYWLEKAQLRAIAPLPTISGSCRNSPDPVWRLLVGCSGSGSRDPRPP